MIDARQLHAWLGIKDPFHQWVRRRVAEYGFEEGTDYLLTLDTAKELAMVERTSRALR